VILAVVHRNISLFTNPQHQTYLLHIVVRWETPATRGHMQQHPSSVYGTLWLLLISFWHEANYIVLRTSHFFSLPSSSPIPHQKIIETQLPQLGETGSKSSRLMGATSIMSVVGTQQEYRHQLVHHNAGNSATRNLTQDAHLKIVRKIGSSKNKKHHAVGCKYMHIVVNGHGLTVYWTAVVRRELRDELIATCTRWPQSLTKAFVPKARNIEHHDVVSSWLFADEFPDKHPSMSTKQASLTLEEAMEGYMVQVIAESLRYKQQLIPCRFSTCPLLWQGQEVGYSWNSPTCTWCWIWRKWPKEGFRTPQLRKPNSWSRNLTLRSENRQRGVLSFLGLQWMKTAIERHPAMLHQNHTAGCLPCQNGVANNLQKQCWRKGTSAPAPDQWGWPSRERIPPLPWMPPTPTHNNSTAQCSQIVDLLARYAYSHTSLPCAELFSLNASAQDCLHNTAFDPDMLTDEGTSTG